MDLRLPDGGNCYRRVLMRVLLDRRAADRAVMFGFNSGGGPKSGHAWLATASGAPPIAPGRYDATFIL